MVISPATLLFTFEESLEDIYNREREHVEEKSDAVKSRASAVGVESDDVEECGQHHESVDCERDPVADRVILLVG